MMYLHSRSVASFFQTGDTPKTIAPRQADINIFTVASGLLYEVRLIRWKPSQYLTVPAALRIHYDFECSEEYEQHSEVLVH